ncbi:MAG TPA: hypothetical protein VH985_15365, partial [Candidatus Binatia bacterium]
MKMARIVLSLAALSLQQRGVQLRHPVASLNQQAIICVSLDVYFFHPGPATIRWSNDNATSQFLLEFDI